MNQKVLEDSLEKTGVWISKHPSGALSLQCGGEQFHIFPHPTRWTYRVSAIGMGPHKAGFYARKDVDLMVHEVMRWGWANGLHKNHA